MHRVNESKQSDKPSDLGDFIRQQRERANLSLRRLADNAGISNPYLSQIERGIRKPSAEILKRLSRALEISANSLYFKAGLIDDDFESPSVVEAVDADQVLTSQEKKVLLDLYRNMVRARGLASANQENQE
jgi:transcriptional regulator with XRE-family HTH domain